MPEYDYCEIRKRKSVYEVRVIMKPIEFIMKAYKESKFVEELNALIERYSR